MAEAAGLAVGGIALASLVTTCVEFIEYFENGRDCARDFTLAVTKVKLMQIRLDQLGVLGEMLSRPSSPDKDTAAARCDWHHVAEALPQGFSGIKDIIERATKLCRRYSYGRYHGTSMTHECAEIATQPTSDQGSDSSGEVSSTGRRAVLQSLSRSVAWALHDKRKFEALISDFDFVLSNLEKIIESFYAGTSKQNQETPKMSDNVDYHMHNTTPPPTPGMPDSGVHEYDLPASVTPTPNTWYLGNYGRGQSAVFVGGEHLGRDGENDRQVLGGTSRYQANNFDEQSYGVVGPSSGESMKTIAESWKDVAQEAIRKKTQPAQTTVREKTQPKAQQRRREQ